MQWGKRENELEFIEEHLEDYIILKIIDVVTTVLITFMIIKMFEPLFSQNTLAAQAAVQAMLKRM